jgi:hypothetical protein
MASYLEKEYNERIKACAHEAKVVKIVYDSFIENFADKEGGVQAKSCNKKNTCNCLSELFLVGESKTNVLEASPKKKPNQLAKKNPRQKMMAQTRRRHKNEKLSNLKNLRNQLAKKNPKQTILAQR